MLFLGSSCIYPRECPQPIKEEYLLTGPLEPTNEPYAIAKIAGLKSAEFFKQQYGLNWYSAMPTNLYGEHDNFHCKNSHVIPGLIARMDDAIKSGDDTFEVWGSGKPRREFLYVDDMARACIFLMQTDTKLPGAHINIGTGSDITTGELAALIAKLMGFNGELIQNTDHPDGMMKKLLDVSKINSLGWKAQVSLEEGLKKSIDFYRNSKIVRKK
jgi:GDP-L-fucose synthase